MSHSNIDTERWLPVIGYERLYDVSDRGRVRSLNRVITYPNGLTMCWKGKVLTPGKTGDRVTVVLCSAQGQISHYVHDLVLTSFIGPCPPNMECCHNDNNGLNNVLTNIRWDTRSENMYDRVRHGVHHARLKTHCPFDHILKQPNLIPSAFKKGFRNCLTCSRTRSYLKRHPDLCSKFTEIADAYYQKIMKEVA